MDCKIGILKTRSVKNLVGAGWYRMVCDAFSFFEQV